MKTNPLKDGVISENSGGVGTVTRKMVRTRAAELAVIDGLLSSAATKSHFAQAKRENTFSKSRDVREDRGTREMKTSHNDQTNHAT